MSKCACGNIRIILNAKIYFDYKRRKKCVVGGGRTILGTPVDV